MISEVITQETAVFLLSALHGILVAALYDLIRALRRVFLHGTGMIALEDLLFWLTAGFWTFCFLFQNTDGVIRGYIAAGFLLGAVLYHVTISDLAVRLAAAVLLIEKKAVMAVIHTLSKPVKKIWQIWKKMIEFAQKKGYNASKMRRDRPENDPKKNICDKVRNKRGRQYGTKKEKTQQK